MSSLPQVGKVYAFYDDGKVGSSRQFLAIVTRIIPFDSNDINHKIFGKAITNEDDIAYEERQSDEFLHSIKEYWEYNKKDIDWVFATETDYIVECAIPIYDDHLIYFARTKTDEWFSFEIQSSWQCGFLDVEGINDEFLIKELKDKRSNNIL